METLPALRYCFEVACEREATDHERSWQWSIRRKVLQWSISRLEREQGTAGSATALTSGPLTAAEQRSLDVSHPLLRLAATPGLPAFEPTAEWRTAIHARVQKYLASLKARG